MQYRYAKTNNKYMNNYDKSKELLYIQYLDAKRIVCTGSPSQVTCKWF